jgi:molecular chaperone DnaK
MSDLVAGIDLGTSNSVVTVMLEGEPIVIPDREDNRIHPSVVHFEADGETQVGAAATQYRITDPSHTVYSSKRLIGRPFSDPDVKVMMGSYPYPIVEGPEGQPRIKIHNQLHPPEGIAGRILHYLRGVTREYLGEPIERAVITVPANFDEGQRRATKRAGEMAGLDVLRLVNEPTAAALAYGHQEGRRERIAIYDFGGGTFDISILELRDNVYQVVSTAGNSYLGGDDLDYRLVSMMLNAFERQHGYDLSSEETVQQRLKSIAQDLKHQLTDRDEVSTQISEYVPGGLTELDLNFSVTRDEFERRCKDIVDQTLQTCEGAIEAAGMQPAEIDQLVMVGGSTRIPLVQKRVSSYFNRKPVLDINPDEVVSIGAAIFGDSLSTGVAPEVDAGQAPVAEESAGLGEADDAPLLIDVTPHALGVATIGGVMDVIIEQNGSLPLERSRSFSTSRDNQTRVVLPIFAGNSRRIEDNKQLGALTLEDIPAKPREEIDIDVTFSVDTDGMLSVSAVEKGTGQRQSAQLSIMGLDEMPDEVEERDLAESAD